MTSFTIKKSDRLPLAFAGLGVGYFALTHLQKPLAADWQAFELWERHKRDAAVALAFGLAAGAALKWLR